MYSTANKNRQKPPTKTAKNRQQKPPPLMAYPPWRGGLNSQGPTHFIPPPPGRISAALKQSAAGRGGGGGGLMGWVIRIIFDPNTRQWGGVSRVMIRGSLLDHSWTLLDHFACCTFNSMPMVLWTCGSFFGSQIVGTREFPFWVHFLRHIVGPICCCVILIFGSYIFGSFFATQIGGSISCFVRAVGDTYIWKLHFWIIFCTTNWWINM